MCVVYFFNNFHKNFELQPSILNLSLNWSCIFWTPWVSTFPLIPPISTFSSLRNWLAVLQNSWIIFSRSVKLSNLLKTKGSLQKRFKSGLVTTKKSNLTMFFKALLMFLEIPSFLLFLSLQSNLEAWLWIFGMKIWIPLKFLERLWVCQVLPPPFDTEIG